MDIKLTIALIALSGVIFTALFKLVEVWYTYYLNKHNSIKVREQKELLSHSFFSKIKYWTDYKITTLHFGDDDRNYIYRQIITIKFLTIAEKVKDFLLSKGDINSMDKEDFKSQVFQMISDIIVSYNCRICDDFVKTFKEGRMLYEMTMNDSCKGFNSKHSLVVDFVERMSNEACDINLGLTNVEKCEIILDIFQAALGSTLPHLERTYCGMNGSLSELLKYGRR